MALSTLEQKVLRTVPAALTCSTCGCVGAIAEIKTDRVLIRHPGRPAFPCSVPGDDPEVLRAVDVLSGATA